MHGKRNSRRPGEVLRFPVGAADTQGGTVRGEPRVDSEFRSARAPTPSLTMRVQLAATAGGGGLAALGCISTQDQGVYRNGSAASDEDGIDLDFVHASFERNSADRLQHVQ